MRIRAGEILTATITVAGFALAGHGVARIVGEYLPARVKHISCVLNNPNNHIELCAEDLDSFKRKEDILEYAVREEAVAAALISAGSTGHSVLRNRRENLSGEVW